MCCYGFGFSSPIMFLLSVVLYFLNLCEVNMQPPVDLPQFDRIPNPEIQRGWGPFSSKPSMIIVMWVRGTVWRFRTLIFSPAENYMRRPRRFSCLSVKHKAGLSSFEDRQEWHFHQHPAERNFRISVSRAQFQDALLSLVAGLNPTQIQQIRFLFWLAIV